MSVQLNATVTRASNGSVDLRPSPEDAKATGVDLVVVHIASQHDLTKRYPVDGVATVTIAPIAPSVADVPAAERRKKS